MSQKSRPQLSETEIGALTPSQRVEQGDIPLLKDMIKDMVVGLSQEDLLGLIESMIQCHPDLLSLVEEVAAQASSCLLDVAVCRRQIQRALEREDSKEIAADLRILSNIAQQLALSGDRLTGGTLYQLLLEETTRKYDDDLCSLDCDDEVNLLSQEFAQGLGDCLVLGAGHSEPRTRQQWLFALLEAFLNDIELGGIDYAKGACEFVLNCATDAEWSQIEARIRTVIEQYSGWEQESLVRCLAVRQERMGNREAAKALICTLGTPRQQAFLLVELGQIESAVAIARHHFAPYPSTLHRFADALVAANAGELAAQLVVAQNQAASHWGHEEWLNRYYQKQGVSSLTT